MFRALAIFFVYLTNYLINIRMLYTLSVFFLCKVSTISSKHLSTKPFSKIIVLLCTDEAERVQKPNENTGSDLF